MSLEDDRPLATLPGLPRRLNGPSSWIKRVQALAMPPSKRPALRVASVDSVTVLFSATVCLAYLLLTAAPAKSTSQAAPETVSQTARNEDLQSGKGPRALPIRATTQKVVLESKGYIIAAHQILVSPKVSGVVTHLPIEEGSRIKKGDILAEVEDVDYRTDYDRCVGECESARQKLLELERGNRPEGIAQAKAQLEEAEAQLTQLEADWKRMQQLHKTAWASAAADYDIGAEQVLGRRAASREAAIRLFADADRIAEGEDRRGPCRRQDGRVQRRKSKMEAR